MTFRAAAVLAFRILPPTVALAWCAFYGYGWVRVNLLGAPETAEDWHGDNRLSERDGLTGEDALRALRLGGM